MVSSIYLFSKPSLSRPALHQNSASTSGLTLLDYKVQIKGHNSLNNMSYFTNKNSFASLIHVSYSPEFFVPLHYINKSHKYTYKCMFRDFKTKKKQERNIQELHVVSKTLMLSKGQGIPVHQEK